MSEVRKILSTSFFLGFIGGIFYTNLIAHDYLTMTSVFNLYYLEQFKGQNIAIGEFVMDIISLRVLPLFGFALLAYTKFHKVGILLCILWAGFLWGIYLSVGVVVLGIKGIILCVLGILPQIFFYLPGYLILMIYAHQYPNIRWNFTKTIVVALCILCGVVIECNVNPVILRWFIGVM